MEAQLTNPNTVAGRPDTSERSGSCQPPLASQPLAARSSTRRGPPKILRRGAPSSATCMACKPVGRREAAIWPPLRPPLRPRPRLLLPRRRSITLSCHCHLLLRPSPRAAHHLSIVSVRVGASKANHGHLSSPAARMVQAPLSCGQRRDRLRKSMKTQKKSASYGADWQRRQG